MASASVRSFFARSWVRLLTVLAVCGANFFAHLGALPVTLMEARNFVAAREMAAGGSWVLPTMNGQLRLAKPPLPTWAVATVMQLTDGTANPALLRLPAALMATLLVLFFWGLVRELTRAAPLEVQAPGRTAWLAALVLGSSLLVVTVGREGQWDIFANSLAVGSLWLLARGSNQPGPAYATFAGAGLLLGGCLLSKGPVSLYTILLPFVAAYLTNWQPGGRARLRAHGRGLLLGLVVALVVGGAWPLYVWQHVPAAAAAVARLEVTSWSERHVEPVWYYFNFAVFVGVWALVALAALALPYAQRRANGFVPYGFALAWLLASLLLLSIVPTKKERYMLPLLPPLVLLLTGLLRYWEQEVAAPGSTGSRADQWLLRGWAGLLTLAAVAGPVALGLARLPGFAVSSPVFILISVALAALAATAAWAGWQQRPSVLMAASITAMSVLMLGLMPAYAALKSRSEEPGLRRLTQVRARPEWQQLPWLALDELHIEQVWKAGHAVPTWVAPPDSLPPLPAVVVAAAPMPRRLPEAWRGRVRVVRADSFYLGSKRADGQFFVGELVPVDGQPKQK
ncbi:glycosyltransferase family 39 protein [Hymenobacter sp. BT635]|uniref:Glycosyltransferase family 39 protein n=1 Tax=Hymenobacter nitidus TaxID=2880929 RepID=A0ABS8AGU3_9BACT|nr:glycosyltransferase family 39 protein [Hymenobacter nitidus]MCB2378440.1 glycosyltransferase family 39 protein [Hymenobacter nitidus]